MPPEHEYRSLLLQAQKSAELIRTFLDAVSKSPRAQENPSIRSRIELAATHTSTVEQELDQIWDEFKRTLKG